MKTTEAKAHAERYRDANTDPTRNAGAARIAFWDDAVAYCDGMLLLGITELDDYKLRRFVHIDSKGAKKGTRN